MISGRVWKFGDNINTDLMLPGPLLLASEAEQARGVFSANRPGWVDQVRPGDILVGGRNFGTGSSRPAARSLRNLGLGALVAESLNGLFFRNAVSFGFLALECPGIAAAVDEGQTAEISLAAWTVRNCGTGAEVPVRPLPDRLLSLMTGGGIYPLLEARGLIAAQS
jgi:3-isopropylmalate/(R)-2-methylmalate dehydratase small subunit